MHAIAMFRKPSSNFVPFALRAFSSPRILSESVTTAFNGAIVKRESSCSGSNHFSTDAKKLIDRNLVESLRPKIESAAKLLSLDKSMPVPPPNFPFEIQDDPYSKITIVRRWFAYDESDVESDDTSSTDSGNEKDEDPEDDYKNSDVNGESSPTQCSDDDYVEDYDVPDAEFMYAYVTEVWKDNDNESDNNTGDSSSTDSSKHEPSDHVKLDLTTWKYIEGGMRQFKLKVLASDHSMKILNLSLTEILGDDEAMANGNEAEYNYRSYPLEKENKGDDDLKSALRGFMEIRGFNSTNIGYVSKYMIWKFRRDRLHLLERVNTFVWEETNTSAMSQLEGETGEGKEEAS